MKGNEKLTDNQKEQLQKIGEKLRQLRIDKGYSNYENFAYDNGLNRANYGRYEKGANLRISTLISILECHGLTLDDFYKLD
jgi:hypothetical protein